MLRSSLSRLTNLAFLSTLMLLPVGGFAIAAEEAAKEELTPAEKSELSERPELAARMQEEKKARHDCKVEICKAFAEPKADGGPISCDVTKTWLASQIQARILGDRLSWPWGHAQCKIKIEVNATDIAKARTEAASTMKLPAHTLDCALEDKDGKADAYALKVTVTPEVTFENGAAKSVVMNWGTIEAPVLAKTAIWSATAVDKNFSVIANGVTNEVNHFMFESCKQEGVEIAKK